MGNPPSLSPSLDKGGGTYYTREASPLFNSPLDPHHKGGRFILRGASSLLILLRNNPGNYYHSDEEEVN